MNLYPSFNQLINVNMKRSFAATLRRGGIPNDEREPRIGSTQLRRKPRRVASCVFHHAEFLPCLTFRSRQTPGDTNGIF